MKVFVTGACGQLGFDVVSELVSRGMEAAAADILPEAGDLPERVSYVQLDITDPDVRDKRRRNKEYRICLQSNRLQDALYLDRLRL